MHGPAVRTQMREDLLNSIRPDTPRTVEFRAAVERCFDCADTVARRREDIAYDRAMTSAQRKDDLYHLVRQDLFPKLAGAVSPVRSARQYAQAERAKYEHGSVPAALSGLLDDIGAVDSALYFARSEMAPAGDLSPLDFDAMTQTR